MNTLELTNFEYQFVYYFYLRTAFKNKNSIKAYSLINLIELCSSFELKCLVPVLKEWFIEGVIDEES